MKVPSSVDVPLVNENKVQCGCETGVESSVKKGEIALVEDSHDTVPSDRLMPASHSEKQPSCETPVKSLAHLVHPIGSRTILQPSTAQNCSKIVRTKREQNLSHALLKMLGIPTVDSFKRLNFDASPLCTSFPSRATVNQSSVKQPSLSGVKDLFESGNQITDCPSPLHASNTDVVRSRKRVRTTSESDGESLIGNDCAELREMPRNVSMKTRSVNNGNCENTQTKIARASCELKPLPTNVETSRKVHSCNTSSVKISFSRAAPLSLAPKPRPMSFINKKNKFSISCRRSIFREPLGPVPNTTRIRLPKRSAVRVVARRDVSPTNHSAIRTRFYTPPQRVVGGRKHREYLRLRAMLPGPRRRAAVSKVSVVCEAARHIEQLHGALIRRFRERLPPALAGCGLSSSDVGQRNIRQLVLRVLAACNPGSLPPAHLENPRSHSSLPQRPRGGDRRR